MNRIIQWAKDVSRNQYLIIHKLNFIMATLADLQVSVQALKDAVSKIPAPGTGAPSVLESDLDPIKADIDAATLEVISKIPA